jgi:hypothetical protein
MDRWKRLADVCFVLAVATAAEALFPFDAVRYENGSDEFRLRGVAAYAAFLFLISVIVRIDDASASPWRKGAILAGFLLVVLLATDLISGRGPALLLTASIAIAAGAARTLIAFAWRSFPRSRSG